MYSRHIRYLTPASPPPGPASAAAAQDGEAARLPRVWVLATGGTISGNGTSSTSLTEYKGGSYLGAELVAAVPEIAHIASVEAEQVTNVGSSDLTLDDWLALAKRIDSIFCSEPDALGIVITHGTNTLEETAYFLNLCVKHDRPVVLVGAQRPPTAISADGPINLLNAIRVATSDDARGKGVLIVMNEEINAARDATKTNTYRVEAFRAPELGYLGYVDGDRVVFYRAPTKRHTVNSEFSVEKLRQLPTVDIVYSYIDPNPAIIRALLASGVRGIVFAGAGAGYLSKTEQDALKPVFESPPDARPTLVASSRTGNGRVVGRVKYDAMGIIPADNLNPQKARILLMLALTKTKDPAEIRRIFSEY